MRRFVLVSGLILFLAACATPSPTLVVPTETLPSTATSTTSLLPGGNEDRASVPTPWRLEGEPRRYDRETLYDLVNGAADLYFSYGFVEVTVSQVVDDEGQSVRVEVYEMASEADAYGLYSYHSYGEPVELGIDGEREPGHRLAFWQDRTFVQIVAREAVDDERLWALGQAVAERLPQSGVRPALVDALPAEGQQPGSVRFFRAKIALDNLLWLGTDDLLGLGPDVEGVVARYEVRGEAADLLLVSYPDAGRAERAQAALEGSEVERLVAVRQRERVLGAVFGSLANEAAEALLAQALDN
jgi:hypothetical protein